MAKTVLLIIAASMLMGYALVAEAGYEPASDAVIHVGGKVECQDCTQGWNEWAYGGKPLQGSKVSITCLDGRKRVVYYGSDDTDKAGEFNLIINKYIYGKELEIEGCSVRLVSSPDPTCDILTDFAGGKSGVTLKSPSLIYRDLIKYIVGPFYFTSPMCDEPDTSDDTDETNH